MKQTKSAVSFFIFFAGGPGKISISPLRPPCTPRNPIETIAPRGVRHCTPCLYCTKRRHHLWGGAAERKRSLGGNSKTAWLLRAVPLSATHFVRVHERWLEYGRLATLPLAILPIPPDSPLASSPTGRARLESPARGDSFWVVLPPACPERAGGCECNGQL